MDKPRRQHYVPQTYLNMFDCGGYKRPHLYVLAVADGRIYNSAVEDAAVEKDFYTLKINKQKLDYVEDYAWENHYAQNIEPDLSLLLRTIISKCENPMVQNNASVLSSKEKEKLSLHIHAQLLRGKHARKRIRGIYTEVLPQILEKARQKFPLSDTKLSYLRRTFETNVDYFQEASMNAILNGTDIGRYIDLMMKRSFVIYRSFQNAFFITSDHPVAFVNANTQISTAFTNGLIYPSTIIMFPISRNLLLCAYHPGYCFGLFSNKDCRIAFLNSSGDLQFIQQCNQIQYDQCSEYIYSNSRDVLETLNKKR